MNNSNNNNNTNDLNNKDDNMNKDLSDMTLTDISASIGNAYDNLTWDNTKGAAGEAYDATVDAVTNTSLNDITASISESWDDVCSFFTSDDNA